MAIIKCPECGKDVSDKATVCPNCGCPQEELKKSVKIEKEEKNVEEITNKNDEKPKTNLKPIIIVVVVVLALIGLALLVTNGFDNDSSDYEYEDSTPVSTIQYISNRSAQYNEEDKQYVVFFALEDNFKKFVSATGTATIVIKDDSGIELYSENLPFTPDDFTSWSNKFWDNDRYMCGLYINRSDIKGSSSSTATLTLSVILEDGTYFDPYNIQLFDLPIKQISIKLPSFPKRIYNYTYRGTTEKIIDVTNIKYETTTNYDGKSTVEFTATVSLVANYSTSTSSYSEIGYKLKNSNGVIVDSGTTYVDPMAVGETVLEKFSIYNLDPNETYSMTLENVK